MLRSRLSLAAILLVAAACSEPTSPEVEGRFAFIPPDTYEAWWDQVERCANREGDFSRIRWYRIPAFRDRPTLLGQWNSLHEITIRSDLVDAWPVVAHEMLHDLLDGDEKHGDLAWLNCAIPIGTGG